MLKQRILTAIALIAIVLLAIVYLPPGAFAIVTLVPLLLAGVEWATLVGLQTKMAKAGYVIVLLLMAAAGFVLPVGLIFSVALAWWTLAAVALLCYAKKAAIWSQLPMLLKHTRWFAGVLVLVPCWVSLNYIKETGDGAIHLLLLLVIVWGMDTGAYFVGRRFGRKRLAPLISPNKSVEGFYGGLIVAIAAFILLGLCFDSSLLGSLFFAGIMLLTAIFAVVGDLFESMIKRVFNKKDSGQLLPGHGGILDRIDSLTAAAPCFAFGLWVLQLGWQ